MIDVAIRLENMSEIEQKLDKLNANAANEIKKAVNETARKTKKELAEGARRRYTAKRPKYSDAMQIRGATVSNLTAELTASTPPIPLVDGGTDGSKANFKVSVGKKATKVQILKGGSLKELKVGGIKAFVNNIARKGQTRKKDTEKGKAGSQVLHIAMAQREGRDRLHINEKFGPSVAAMLGGTFKAQEHTIREDLQTALEKHIELWMKE